MEWRGVATLKRRPSVTHHGMAYVSNTLSIVATNALSDLGGITQY